MCGISGNWPRPFAVGVLAWAGPDRDVRLAERLHLAMDAYKLGYFLVDTIEAGRDGVGYLTAERLAVHTDADALVVRGPVDRARLAEMADRLRLVVHGSVALPP